MEEIEVNLAGGMEKVRQLLAAAIPMWDEAHCADQARQ